MVHHCFKTPSRSDGSRTFCYMLMVWETPTIHNIITCIMTRNTVNTAHKMILPALPCFVWQSPCFALGHPKIIRIKT